MAEHHAQYSATTVPEILWAIYQHTQDPSAQIALGDDGGTDLVFDGTTWGGTPTSASYFSATTSKIVIQGVHPNAEKWWVEFQHDSSTTVGVSSGFDGLYTTGGGFTGVSFDTGGHLVSPATGDHVRLSSSLGEDTYNSGTSAVNYFRLMFWNASGTAYDWGVYAGNFIPFDQTEGKPFVFLSGIPNSGSGIGEWGENSTGTGGTWANASHSASTFTGVVTHQTAANGINVAYQDYSGNFITSRCYIHSAFSYLVGYIGDHAFRATGETATANGTLDVSSGYFANTGFVHRWSL